MKTTAQQLQAIILRYGWTVDPKKVPATKDAKQPDAIQNWLQADSNDDTLMFPEELWHAIELPYPQRVNNFRNDNDAKAILTILFETRRDFSRGFADPSTELCKRVVREGAFTKYGSVFVEPGVHDGKEDRPFRLWVGPKAGKVPTLEGPEGNRAIRRLMAFQDPDTNPPDETKRESPKKSEAKQPKLVAKKATIETTADGPAMEFILIDRIQPSPENDRKVFDKSELAELADSIRENGVLQPILLRPLGNSRLELVDGKQRWTQNSRFEIVAGERRWRASQLAGKKVIPAMISERDDRSTAIARLHENTKRVDLTPIERAQAIQRLIDAEQLTQKQAGEVLGVQQGQVSNELRLLNLPPRWQQYVAKKILAPTAVRVLLTVTDFPQVFDELDKSIPELATAKEPFTEDLKPFLREAVKKCSRSMKQDVGGGAWSAPSKTARYFRKTGPENEKALNVQTFEFLQDYEGKKRTFNTKLFDELNKAALAKKREAHKQYKEKNDRRATSGPEKKPVLLIKQLQEYSLRNHLTEDLKRRFAKAVPTVKDSNALNRVVLALMIDGRFNHIVGRSKVNGNDRYYDELLTYCDKEPKAVLQSLHKQIAKAVESYGLRCCNLHSMATVLGFDLLEDWKPTKFVLQQLTDEGLRECFKELCNQQPPDKTPTVDQLLRIWQAGIVPSFLAEHLGIKKEAKSKAKKAKAA